MIVNDPLQVTALDLTTGRLLWTQETPVDAQSLQNHGLLFPSRPVVTGSRIVLRRVIREGVELTCLDALDGQVLWRNYQTADRVPSEPLVFQQEVFTLTAAREVANTISLFLTRYDIESGEMTGESFLADFGDIWPADLPCRATAVDDKIVATVGGAVLCCDLSGHLRWLRSQTFLPEPRPGQPPLPKRPMQAHNPPLVAGGRVYAAQPDVFGVDCISLTTGRLLWRRAQPDLHQLLGVSAPRLIAQTEDGLMALDSATGKLLWNDEEGPHLLGGTFSAADGILYAAARRPADKASKWPACLAWLDPQTGKRTATAPLEVPSLPRRPVARLLICGNRMWALSATAEIGEAEIWEVTRTSEE
jgi:outer membrane protein assembly factor BamB